MVEEIQKYNYLQHEWCIYKTIKSSEYVMEYAMAFNTRLFNEMNDVKNSEINFCYNFNEYIKKLNYLPVL